MKLLLLKLVNLFKKNTIDLDGDGKIESYKQEMRGVLSQFTEAYDKLTEVSLKLADVVQEEVANKDKSAERIETVVAVEHKKQEKSDEVINKAGQELQATAKLQEKLKEFIL